MGNPIHCADGEKRQHDVDYQAPLGPLRLTRTYLNRPRSDSSKTVLGVRREGSLSKIQIKAGTGFRDPSWLVNIPRMIKYGDALTGVDMGDGTRLIFNEGEPGIESFGSIEEGDQETTYTTQSGTKFFFDDQRRATRQLLRNGQYVDYEYVSDHQTILTDNFGRELRIEHDEKGPNERNVIGRIRKVTDPAGIVTSYTYNVDGMIESVSNSGINGTKYYSYQGDDDDILLTQITDELGVPYASWEYDEYSRAISSSHHNNAERVEVEYLEYNNVDKIASSITREYRNDSQALETEYQFKRINGATKPVKITQKPCENCTPATTEYTYDYNGLLDKVSVLGGQTTDYDYSTRGLVTKQVTAPGTPEARTTSYSWHSEFSLPTRTINNTISKNFSYDDSGNLLSTSYGYANTNRTDYTYNQYGQVLTIDGPRTDVQDITTFEYLPNGNLSRVVNALDHVTEITQHDAYGRPTRIVDPNGAVTSLIYNAKGWLLSSAINGDTTQIACLAMDVNPLSASSKTKGSSLAMFAIPTVIMMPYSANRPRN